MHPLPPGLFPGPGSFNVFIGGLPAWRGIPAGAVAGLQAAKQAADTAVQAAETATKAAAGSPGAPVAIAAELATKTTVLASMGSAISSAAAGSVTASGGTPDIHACMTPSPVPPHGPGIVIDGSKTVFINGLPACRQGDTILEALGPTNKIRQGLASVLIGDATGAVSPDGDGPGGAKGAANKKGTGGKSALNAAQEKRAAENFAKLGAADKKSFQDLLAKAKSERERQYLLKALAAGHSLDKISAFADKIRGKSDTWLNDNLRLTGSSTGRGVQQQWSHSCNATMVQAVRGEMDPLYSLKVHEDNPNFNQVDDKDATAKNPNLAAEQKAMLESKYGGTGHQGVAAHRGAAGGSGRWADDLLNQNSDVTGVTYSTQKNPTVDQAVTSIDDGLKTGAPVPIVIGNGPSQFTHYVLVTGSEPGPPKTYTIHDPWEGKTVQRTEDQMRNGQLDIAGSNGVTAVEKPTPTGGH
jgi:uncharacterized Zn-binding protein involved in type VI secretion